MNLEIKIIVIITISCLVASYLFVKLVYKAVSPFKKVEFWITLIISSLFLFSIYPFILVFTMFYESNTPNRKFNSEDWKINKSKRIELIDDLIEKKQLDSLLENEVIDLLGEPLTNCGYFLSSGRDMIYHLGPERSLMRIDSEWLLIWVENDHVKKYEIRTD